jgi:hypothetical protein
MGLEYDGEGQPLPEPNVRIAFALERLANMAEARELRSWAFDAQDPDIDSLISSSPYRAFRARMGPLLSLQEQVAATGDADRAGEARSANPDAPGFFGVDPVPVQPPLRTLLRGLANRFALEAAGSSPGTSGERAWHQATAIVRAMEDKVCRGE